jgi:hypothetical protein
MRWDALLKAAGDVAATHPDLAAIFGDNIRLHGTWKLDTPGQPDGSPPLPNVPLLELRLVSDLENELWAPTIIQWDIWVKTLPEAVRAERALRRLFHADSYVTIGGIEMWSEYLDGDSSTATPDRDGFFGRAIRFRHTPLRERYAAAPSTGGGP